MKITDLSAEDQALVKQEFSPELEKEAAEHVKLAQELYTTGFSKLAQETADELDKLAEFPPAKDEDKDKDKDKDEKKLDEEQKKEAATRGAFIAQGFIDGLKKLGQERHGDELAYLYPFVNEKLAFAGKQLLDKGLAGVAAAGKTVAGKSGELAGKAFGRGDMAGKAMGHAAKAVGQGAGMVAKHPGKAVGGAAVAGAGLAGLKMMGRKDKN